MSVIVYDVIAEPPFAGAVYAILSEFTAAVAVGADICAGTVVAVIVFEYELAAE